MKAGQSQTIGPVNGEALMFAKTATKRTVKKTKTPSLLNCCENADVVLADTQIPDRWPKDWPHVYVASDGSIYGLCGKCGRLVKINKVFFGSLHICRAPAKSILQRPHSCGEGQMKGILIRSTRVNMPYNQRSAHAEAELSKAG